MARKARNKPQRPQHFLREWRQHRGLSLEQVTERLQILSSERPAANTTKRIGITHGNLSRIERGKVPYSQSLLEMLAEIYQADPASLIVRDPSDPQAIWSIWDQIEPAQRVHAADVLRTFIPKTGTDR